MVIGSARAHQTAARRWRGPRVGVAAVVLAGLALGTAYAAPATEAISIVRTDGVRVEFRVEHAIAPADRRRGLMHRTELPPGHGMLFDFGGEGRLQMWMKDTHIPLDMLFIDETGTVIHIGEGVPRSTALVEAGRPARYVLEINAGESARLGIAPGDRVLVPALRSSAAPTPGRR